MEKFIYNTHALLREIILRPTTITSFMLMVVTMLVAFVTTDSASQASFITVGFYSTAYVADKALIFLKQVLILPTGFLSKFKLPGTHFKRGTKTKPSILSLDFVKPDRFEFATEKTAPDAAQLNTVCFSKTRWKGDYEEKFNRNLSHIRKNAHSILLVKSKDLNSYIGFTHVIPVTQDTWNDYLNGQIGDNDYPDKLVVSDGKNGDQSEEPYGLILFSVGDKTRYSPVNYFDRLTHRLELGDLYEQAVVFQLHTIMKHYGKKKMRVLFQNESIEYQKFFKQCAKYTSKESKDKARIYVLDVELQ